MYCVLCTPSVSVIHSLLLFVGNKGVEDIITHLRALDPTAPFWEVPFGMSRQLAGDLHRSLRESFGEYSSSLLFCCLSVCVCKKGTVISFLVLCCLANQCVFRVFHQHVLSFSSSRWERSFGKMTVSALEALIQACVRDGLTGAVTRPQASVSHVLSQFGVKSVPAVGSSAEFVLPGGDSGRQSETLGAPRVAREGKIPKKIARSC